MRHFIAFSAIAAIGLFACVLSAVPLMSDYRHTAPGTGLVDVFLLTRLAVDIGQGLAFEVLVALGVVLAASLGLGVGTAAAADGPKNEQESAVCGQVLGWALSLTPSTLEAVCRVQGNGD